jgi:hypothetical protein
MTLRIVCSGSITKEYLLSHDININSTEEHYSKLQSSFFKKTFNVENKGNFIIF